MKFLKLVGEKISKVPKIGWIALIMAIVLIAYVNRDLLLQIGKSKTPAVKTVTETYSVKKDDLNISIPQEGTVVFDKYAIAFQTSGKVSDAQVALGAKVKKGDYLASVDSTDSAIQYQQSQVSYAQAKLDLDMLEGPEYQAKKDALEQAKSIYEMEKQNNYAQLQILEEEFAKNHDNNEISYDQTVLQEDNKVANSSDADYQQDLSDYIIETAANNYDYYTDTEAYNQRIQENELSVSLLKAASTLKSAELAVTQQEASIKKAQLGIQNTSSTVSQSKNKVGQTKLYAPVDGVIIAVNSKLGEQAASPYTQIIDTDNIYLQSFVEDTELYQMSVGMKANITFDNLSDKYTGHVTFISPAATQDTGGGSTYEVMVKIDSKDPKILDGLVGDVEFIIKGVDNALVIPNEYVFREDGQSFVNIENADGSTTKTKVELGFSDGKSVEVKSGLSENQKIITTKQVATSTPTTTRPTTGTTGNRQTGSSTTNQPPFPI